MLPEYLRTKPSIKGQKAEGAFLKRHARSGAGLFEKDDCHTETERVEFKLVCKGTKTHVLNWTKIAALVKRAEARGQIPLYIMQVEGVGEFVLTPSKYVKLYSSATVNPGQG